MRDLDQVLLRGDERRRSDAVSPFGKRRQVGRRVMMMVLKRPGTGQPPVKSGGDQAAAKGLWVADPAKSGDRPPIEPTALVLPAR